MSSPSENSRTAPADELRKQSEQDAAVTPMDAVLDAARAKFDRRSVLSAARALVDAQAHDVPRLRRLGPGWAQGINLNEHPPAVAYLFGKQIYSVEHIIVNKPL
jgi:hypothetical protein